MVIYFSATGNSKYIAKRITNALDDEIICINDKIKNNDTSPIEADKRLVIVTPTYAWRIPKIVRDWIKKTEFKGNKNTWFVMSCGGEIGNAQKYNKLLCNEKGFNYMGTAQILMPENYIALFGTPEKDKARQIVSNAQPYIEKTIKTIGENKAFAPNKNSIYFSALSGIVNDMFYPLFVKAKAFSVTDKCISCKKCVNLCPLNNIKLVDKKPVWGSNCTHCMACISYCPCQAIEYGKNSVGKTRYTFESLKIE